MKKKLVILIVLTSSTLYAKNVKKEKKIEPDLAKQYVCQTKAAELTKENEELSEQHMSYKKYVLEMKSKYEHLKNTPMSRRSFRDQVFSLDGSPSYDEPLDDAIERYNKALSEYNQVKEKYVASTDRLEELLNNCSEFF